MLRYVAAFGPATAADVAAWSRLTGLREVVDRLRPAAAPFRDERGRALFDLPDAPRPDPDTPAPPRFLPEYDNVLLSHADRTRFVPEKHRGRIGAAFVERPHGAVLHDGFVRGSWRLDSDDEGGRLIVKHVGPLAKRAVGSLEVEGRRLLRLLAADAGSHDVRFVAVV